MSVGSRASGLNTIFSMKNQAQPREEKTKQKIYMGENIDLDVRKSKNSAGSPTEYSRMFHVAVLRLCVAAS